MPNWTESSHLQRREKKKKKIWKRENDSLFNREDIWSLKTTQTGENGHTVHADKWSDRQ